MKKFIVAGIVLIALIAGVAIVTAGKGRLREGRKTPDLTVENHDSTINLHSLNGNYVLVDFWSSADAGSRLKSNQYTAASVIDKGDVKRISVNFDRSERLFEEIVNRDRLDPASQYYVEGEQAGHIRRAFGLKDEYKSYLIGPNGRILAVNPDPSALERLVRKRG